MCTDTSEVTAVKPPAVVSDSQTPIQERQQPPVPPEYNPETLPPSYPTVDPLYPIPEGVLPTGYPTQQPYPDQPPPYPSAPPLEFTAPQ